MVNSYGLGGIAHSAWRIALNTYPLPLPPNLLLLIYFNFCLSFRDGNNCYYG